MKELAGRLTALDPDAGAAVRVIAYFDRLAESRAGVEALVRGAAVLAGCPARLVDPERRVHVRVEPDGTRRDTEAPPDPTWPSARLTPDATAALWLERAAAAHEVEDTGRAGAAPGDAEAASGGSAPGIVEAAMAGSGVVDIGRAVDRDHAGTASTVANPTSGGAAPGAPDPGRARTVPRLMNAVPGGSGAGAVDADRARAVSRVVDTDRAGATSRVGQAGHVRVAPSVVDAVILERAAGAIRLVLDRTRGRAPADDPALVETLLDGTAPEPARLHAARRLGLDPTAPARALAPLNDRPRVVPAGAQADAVGRLGVGPSVPVLELPRSWAEARTALRFTAEGTPQDPGPRVVYADELGGIALLADLVVPGAEPPPDVRALETAAAATPWLPETLHAVAYTASLRAAAGEINVHHSTLQDRLAHAEHLLGWPVRTPQGRLRLQLALAMRQLARP
ncbi:helix-turn-helix domain-containing protein [Streptomyces coeruleorubidus]|uniref:helix-turn-helix domain-containing protein n=1 Tax=Streptomyces coeruleorubidus TaxID=116188 RepID=UPI0036695E61